MEKVPYYGDVWSVPDQLVGVETLVPAQFWPQEAPDGRGEPERRLMRAVLQDAVLSLSTYSRQRTGRARRIVGEVEMWMASNARSYPFAFATICDVLELDADHVRKAIREWNLALVSPPRGRRTHAGRTRYRLRLNRDTRRRRRGAA
ncbi:MAG: hypothetical protein ACE5I7_00280 [Candidatus Binatia bacterium]